MSNELLPLARALIACRSVTGHRIENERALRLIAQYLPLAHCRIQRITNGGVTSIFVTARGIVRPAVLLCGHVDVVPASPEAFRSVIRRGRLYGRGAFDLKGPVAAMVTAFAATVRYRPPPPVGLFLSTDEERGGRDGVGAWVRTLRWMPRVAVVPDGGNNFDLVVEEKGTLELSVLVRGHAAHASRPWEGANAIDTAAIGMRYLHHTFQPIRHPRNWRTGVVVTQFHSGTTGNQLPDAAELSLNIRYVPSDDPARIIAVVRRAFPHAVVTERIRGCALFVPRSSSDLRRFRSILRRTIGRLPKYARYPSTCDARFFAARDVPVIITRPPGGGAHGAHEWVSVRGLEQFHDALIQFIGGS